MIQLVPRYDSMAFRRNLAVLEVDVESEPSRTDRRRASPLKKCQRLGQDDNAETVPRGLKQPLALPKPNFWRLSRKDPHLHRPPIHYPQHHRHCPRETETFLNPRTCQGSACRSQAACTRQSGGVSLAIPR
jgi:hypothetical protein